MADLKVFLSQEAREECIPVYKARPVSLETELEICGNTHRKIHSSVQCTNILAELGCGEEVLVVEGLCLLEDEFDSFLKPMLEMPNYQQDSQLIFSLASKGSVEKLLLSRVKGVDRIALLASVADKMVDTDTAGAEAGADTLLSSEAVTEICLERLMKWEKLTRSEAAHALRREGWHCGIAKFVTGLIIAAQEVTTTDPRLKNLDKDVKRAAKTTGAVVLKEVLQAVASKHKDNPAMQELVRCTRDVLSAWREVFMRRVSRNIKNHPFLMIHYDVDTADKALSAFEFLLPEYPKLAPLMRASLPLLSKFIQEKNVHEAQQRVEKERNLESVFKLLGI